MSPRSLSCVHAPYTKTKFQKENKPTHYTQALCQSRYIHGDRACPRCGRELPGGNYARPHKPKKEGDLGWIAHYADGSTRLASQKPEDATPDMDETLVQREYYRRAAKELLALFDKSDRVLQPGIWRAAKFLDPDLESVFGGD